MEIKWNASERGVSVTAGQGNHSIGRLTDSSALSNIYELRACSVRRSADRCRRRRRGADTAVGVAP